MMHNLCSHTVHSLVSFDVLRTDFLREGGLLSSISPILVLYYNRYLSYILVCAQHYARHPFPSLS